MTDINLQTITPDTTLPTTGFLFGADSQASGSPSVYTVQSVATTLLGSTTLTGAPITADAPVLNLAQTWNNAAVTFTGLKLNATDTASAVASLLMDLQVGGASKFKVDKSGNISVPNGSYFGLLGLTAGIAAIQSGDVRIYTNSSNSQYAFYNSPSARFVLGSLTSIMWNSVTDAGVGAGGTNDTILTRRDAANLRFGAADAATAVPQKLSVQSVVAGTTNTAGANLTITGSQGTGTGAGGSIIFQVAPAGSSGTAQNALSTALTIASTGNITTTGSVTTQAPTGGTAAAWRLGTVASVSPTSPNRTIEVDIGGTIYYISAKTTNN